jgi:hypothetical protein
MIELVRTNRRAQVAVAAAAIVLLLGGALVLSKLGSTTAPGGTAAVASPTASAPVTGSPAPSPTEVVSGSQSPSPSASPSGATTPLPSTAPQAYEDLSGIATTPELAHRYPLAVMIDDSPAARQQAGLAFASMVWQAPVEGGIARYMMIFQAGTAPRIGPVRSARLYFVRWASEWTAVYLHAGGPPPLLKFLGGAQKLVLNANGSSTNRVTFRTQPHNLYTDGARLRNWAERTRHATSDRLPYDPNQAGRLQPFRDAAPAAARGKDGGTVKVSYSSEKVAYQYDQASNTWLRSVDGHEQHDALDTENPGNGTVGAGPRIAPTTVVLMVVPIRRSKAIDGPALGRLEADSIGSNTAWVFADGRVTKGVWRKKTETDRTRFFDAAGHEIAFPRGQIFMQVVSDASAASFAVEAAG